MYLPGEKEVHLNSKEGLQVKRGTLGKYEDMLYVRNM